MSEEKCQDFNLFFRLIVNDDKGNYLPIEQTACWNDHWSFSIDLEKLDKYAKVLKVRLEFDSTKIAPDPKHFNR